MKMSNIASAMSLVFCTSMDGGLLGVGLAIVASKCLNAYFYYSKAVRETRTAPSLSISHPPRHSHSTDHQLVIVRGIIQAESTVENFDGDVEPRLLKSQNFDGDLVALGMSETPIYKEWKGFSEWMGFMAERNLFPRPSEDNEFTSLTTVPFVVAESGDQSSTRYMSVNLDGSTHSLPLTTIDQCAMFGPAGFVGVLKEEKILPVGKEITAVGFCSMKDGIPQIKSSKGLPVFITDKSRKQLLVELCASKDFMLYSGTVLGVISVGLLGYALKSTWGRWKSWLNDLEGIDDVVVVEDVVQEQVGDAADDEEEELCLVCYEEKKACAFIPCGHHVCCLHCSAVIMIDRDPKCPVCRQRTTSHIRIYSS